MIPTSVRRVLARNSVSLMALVLWMLHIVASSGSTLENKAGDGGEGFECLERGRLHQSCGFLWSSLAGVGQLGPLNGVFQCYEAQKTHTHTYTQGGLTCCLKMKMWLVKLWMKWSSLGKRWSSALRGFPTDADHLHTLTTPLC